MVKLSINHSEKESTKTHRLSKIYFMVVIVPMVRRHRIFKRGQKNVASEGIKYSQVVGFLERGS